MEFIDKAFDWYSHTRADGRIGYRICDCTADSRDRHSSGVGVLMDQRTSAILGAVIVPLTGSRQIFRWRDNWLRFTAACSALASERVLYVTKADEYAGDERDAILKRRVQEIQTAETSGWIQTAETSGWIQTAASRLTMRSTDGLCLAKIQKQSLVVGRLELRSSLLVTIRYCLRPGNPVLHPTAT